MRLAMRSAIHVLGLMLLAAAPSAAWSVRSMRGLSVSRWSAARLSTSAVRCCATEAGEEMPPDFETVCSEAAEAVRDGLLRGRRGLRVDVGVPSLDPGSRMYEPSHLARVCLEIAKVRARARAETLSLSQSLRLSLAPTLTLALTLTLARMVSPRCLAAAACCYCCPASPRAARRAACSPTRAWDGPRTSASACRSRRLVG